MSSLGTKGRYNLGALALGLIALSYALIYILVPTLGLVATSLLTGSSGGLGRDVSVGAWEAVLAPAHLSAFVQSFVISLLVSSLALALAICVGYIYFSWEALRFLILALIGAILLTNPLILTMGWLGIFSAGTVPYTVLMSYVLPDAFGTLLFTDAATLIGLLSVYVPITVFPFLVAIHNLNPELTISAALLGAKRDQVFKYVVIPAARPEIAFGTLATFVSTISDVVVPEVLGGSKRLLLGRLIPFTALEARNPSLAAALVIVLLVLLMAALSAVLSRASNSE